MAKSHAQRQKEYLDARRNGHTKPAEPGETKSDVTSVTDVTLPDGTDPLLAAMYMKGLGGSTAAARVYLEHQPIQHSGGIPLEMLEAITPSFLGRLCVPQYEVAWHIWEMEQLFMGLVAEHYRRLLVSIPIRHGKSEYASLFCAWLLVRWPVLRILRVMASADTARDKARDALKYVERWGWLNGVSLDRRRCSAEHFTTEAGGMMRSIGAAGDVESWTFDWILIDDLITDPYEIRSPNRRDQLYKDMLTKFFSRVLWLKHILISN